ncbi:MAG: hypothetical protein JW910_21110 [Anaerolineae bacterium]|nr:hypothetical protein [Anaerolineae bacterium]
MNRYFRMFMFLVCGVQFVFALGYIFQWPFATQSWPLPYTNQMTFFFIGSIFAAAAASTVWCLMTEEYGALAGVSLDYAAIFIPTSIFAFQISGSSSALRIFSIVALIGAVFGLGMLLWSLRIPIRDPRPMPRLVRWSFVVFIIALVFVGGRMVLKASNILPWDVMTAGQVLYGWMFLGAAAYFAYALVRPSWHNSAGQLAGFLAYDVVLIVPFLLLLPTIDSDRLPSLIIYIGVVSFSGLLAIYYLFINSATRMVRPAH